ncbi:MAG: sigma-54 interaction domain-containing protein [Terriglobales bacterium]
MTQETDTNMNARPQAAEAAAVLVASGDAAFRRQLLEALRAARHEGVEAAGGAEALCQLEAAPWSALLLDRRLPDLDAEELRALVVAQYPHLPVAWVDSTAAAQPALALLLPELPPFASVLDSGARVERPAPAVPLRATATALAVPLRPPGPGELLADMVGRSPHLRELSALVRLVAPRRTPVLLLGETGTGKEMIAEAIHAASPRHARPFAVVNCAAIPEALLESELFGFVRGAFTGAVQSRAGRILSAHTGTLFLDEIGELPLALQGKLLRFLQAGELQRLGSNDPQHVDVRVIAATNVELAEKAASGAFRRDLYYRLAVFPLELQPLRARPEDIVPLARHFLRRLQADCSGPGPCFAPETLDLLEQYPWPGNVRELQHALERAFILAAGEDELQPRHFPTVRSWQQQRGIGPRRAEEWTEATGTHAFV